MGIEQSRIVIALSAGEVSPSGLIEIEGEAGRPFSGWLSLLSELGRVVEAAVPRAAPETETDIDEDAESAERAG